MVAERHTLLRSMHDLGLAAWFGGSLMGAIGLNGAAAQVSDSKQRLGVASAGWARWTPINAAAIGAHVAGATGEMVVESPRVLMQSGVGQMSAVKTGLTLAALAATGYSRMLGMQLEKANGTTAAMGVTEPGAETAQQVASRQRQMKVLQWAIPTLTGALIVVTALAGEQQKPGQVAKGVRRRVTGMAGATRGMRKVMAMRGMRKMMAMRAMRKMMGTPDMHGMTMGRMRHMIGRGPRRQDMMGGMRMLAGVRAGQRMLARLCR
jgi:hypothetical protein